MGTDPGLGPALPQGHFATLRTLNPPPVMRMFGRLVLAGIIIFLLFIIVVPWVQTAQGSGQVIAFDPRDRQQNITALVPGRLERWYVTDGASVKAGEPIARVVDIDPEYLNRLKAERDQKLAEMAATEQAMATAQRDVKRMQTLYGEGLAARRDMELAQIKVADYAAKLASLRADINKIDVNLRRQSEQVIRAPREGRIMRVSAIDTATIVKQGDVLATFVPDHSRRVVELYIDGRDIPLITIGRRVRLEFEGWPAIQFSGWPSVAKGYFDGQVAAMDPNASANGLFRILVTQSPDRDPWPDERSVRLGAKVRGWVQMNTVPIWFELWRILNDFPLQFSRPGAEPATNGEAPTKGESGAAKGSDAITAGK
ncbi:efflux RND transporter periplasmic adaptor subunit [Sandarakinorhabdus rubra]|uniref:efflux RND transporter periplasmic adaptor subunit n=1 Tax=Sandarakinorhabdus rubra TaxID=2672568 RepID=UPI0013DB4163|nr:HlyD family efflux transporter periplasmic adaptor subunit [Sandarakinorhabdus rubra]